MTVTRKEIADAYHMFLGRKAEETEIDCWQHIPSLVELGQRFAASPEFRSRAELPLTASKEPQRLGCDVAPISIEWETDADAQRRLVEQLAQAWNRIGEEEPHWSVLSAEAFKSENIERNAATFYASGVHDLRLVTAVLARSGLTPADLPNMVEYGCGVGRVTPHFASAFSSVLAVDISDSHLALAKSVIATGEHKNVAFVLARAPDFGMTEPFDLWFSNIVLQHNPPPVMAMILRRMFSLLAPGGVAIFQVTTYTPGYCFSVAKYLEAPRPGNIEVHCLPQEVVFEIAHNAGCVPIEVREDSAMGYPWLSNLFVFQKLWQDDPAEQDAAEDDPSLEM